MQKINPGSFRSGDIVLVEMKLRYNRAEASGIHVVSKGEPVSNSSKTVRLEDIKAHIPQQTEVQKAVAAVISTHSLGVVEQTLKEIKDKMYFID